MTLASQNRIQPLEPAWVRYLSERLPGETPHPLDDFFRANTSANYTQTTPTGSATPAFQYDALSWWYSGNSAQDAVTYTKSLGALSSPMTIETAVHLGGPNATTFAGICFTDGTANTSNVIFAALANIGGQVTLASYSGTITALANVHLQDSQLPGEGEPMYLRLCWKSANTWRIAFSIDGITWTNQGTGDLSFTQTPTRLGVFVSAYGTAGDKSARFEYLRVANADLCTGAL